MTIVLKKIRARCARLWRRAVCVFFGLDPWHAGLPSDRKYPADIVTHLNRRPTNMRATAAEIGCGLGDISGRIAYNAVDCYDRDRRVLRAAKLLNLLAKPSNISFQVLDFPGTMPQGYYDVLILVNWIHTVPPDALKTAFNILFEKHLKPGGELIFDTVSDAGYRYHHEAPRLAAGLNAVVVKLGRYDRGRDVFSLHKLPFPH